MASDEPRYGNTAIALHWLIAIVLLAQMTFGFLLDEIAPRGTPARAGVINLHKSVGMTIGLLVMVRLLWRLAHAPPPWPASLAPWQQRAAAWVHRGLYACMVVMPLAGYVASNFSRHGVRYFGIALKPWGPDLPAVYEFCNGVHVATAYVFAVLIAVHIAAALKHAFDRDDVLSRMLPRGAGSPSMAWRAGDVTLKEHP